MNLIPPKKSPNVYGLHQTLGLHIRAKIAMTSLLLMLSACGGGSGSSSSATEAPPSGNTGSPNTPSPTAQSLQAHLSNCPTALTINEKVACMVGLYEGKTTDTGSACTFKYDASGVARYSAGGQSLEADLSLYSAAVFEKKSAANKAGFSVSWTVGIASGKDMDIDYQSMTVPASSGGMLIRPKKTGVPSCLVETGPIVSDVSGGESTANLLGKTWQSPQMLNGSSGAIGFLSDQPAFDAGLADDGRAFITFRQPDASARMAVYVVEGKSGAAGVSPVWSTPLQLDASTPLLTGNFRPRIAVSPSGHAVISWLTERPCEADTNISKPAGQTCRYLYASRRLATESVWEEALRVRYSPQVRSQDHYARINARGDVVLAFSSYHPLFRDTSLTLSALAIRNVVDTSYRGAPLSGFWSSSQDVTAFGERILADLDDGNNLFVAGKSSSSFDVAWVHSTTLLAPDVLGDNRSPVTSASGSEVFELRTGGNGFAAFTWRNSDGSRVSPAKLSIYSPTSQAWLAPYDIKPYTLWGNTNLVGTDNSDGEFLLYSACKLTAWKAGTWGTTRNLPAYCGRDQAGGVYAYNRKGDYLGINWAGKPGQWGYYSYAQDKMLKGAPGNATAAAGDLVLGTAADLFAPASTQLLLSPSGLALAVTTNTFTTLPSAANPAGVTGGAAAKLWAVYLK
jgi:hypothetical protein